MPNRVHQLCWAFLYASSLFFGAEAAHAGTPPEATTAPSAAIVRASALGAAIDTFFDSGEDIGVDVSDAIVTSRIVCNELMGCARAKGGTHLPRQLRQTW